MSTHINRRNALAAVAAGPAVAALGSLPAFASEDAELLRLWDEWRTQQAIWLVAAKHESAVEELVNESWSPWWRFDSINEGRAKFTAWAKGKPAERFELIEAVDLDEAKRKAGAMVAEWDEQRDKAKSLEASV